MSVGRRERGNREGSILLTHGIDGHASDVSRDGDFDTGIQFGKGIKAAIDTGTDTPGPGGRGSKPALIDILRVDEGVDIDSQVGHGGSIDSRDMMVGSNL